MLLHPAGQSAQGGYATRLQLRNSFELRNTPELDGDNFWVLELIQLFSPSRTN